MNLEIRDIHTSSQISDVHVHSTVLDNKMHLPLIDKNRKTQCTRNESVAPDDIKTISL